MKNGLAIALSLVALLTGLVPIGACAQRAELTPSEARDVVRAAVSVVDSLTDGAPAIHISLNRGVPGSFTIPDSLRTRVSAGPLASVAVCPSPESPCRFRGRLVDADAPVTLMILGVWERGGIVALQFQGRQSFPALGRWEDLSMTLEFGRDSSGGLVLRRVARGELRANSTRSAGPEPG